MAAQAQLQAATGALLGTFVGDALGAPHEGSPRSAIPAEIGMREGRPGGWRYTDDTQMMIALAESLVRCDAVDEKDLAAAFRAHFDPSRGYGAGTVDVLDLWDRGVPLSQAAGRVFGGRGSFGNGAAMRVAPVAVRFFDDEALLSTQARRSAALTHAHPVGIDGAVVQAAATAAAMGRRPIADAAVDAAVTKDVSAALDGALRRTEGGLEPAMLSADGRGVPFTAAGSVAAAVAAAARAATFEQAVEAAVRAGGDTDTVAAMAGAIAGARDGAGAIPPEWVDALEDGDCGRSHVIDLARVLGSRAGG